VFGLFEGERVELLYGAIVTMSPTGAPHDGVIQRLTRLLILKLDPLAAIRVQSSFIASERSQPQPDIAVCPPEDYLETEGRRLGDLSRRPIARASVGSRL